MGCCMSKTQEKHIIESEIFAHENPRATGSLNTHQSNSKHTIPQPSAEEKREQLAQAAIARQADWRQGGAINEDKAAALRKRREQDELIGKIEARYAALKKDPPIGLRSCSVDQLKRHMAQLTT